MVNAHIQTAPLELTELMAEFTTQSPKSGAVVTFSGMVRDYNQQGDIDGIELEHYPGMTEKALLTLGKDAYSRFDLDAISIVHRVGKIANYEPIVWVAAASQHRQAAFDAAAFTMDALKQRVPLWKKEWRGEKAQWVEAKQSDAEALANWQAP